jgi:outer membrane protein assembly factor BamB
MKPKPSLAVALLVLTALPVVGTRATDWPILRGPDRNGISKETEWKAVKPKTLWSANAGLGYSGMVVAGGKLYTAGHDDKTDSVVCLDAATGKTVWKHTFPQPLGAHYYQGGTTGCPTVDGDTVYHVAREGEVFALEATSGKVKWTTNLKKEHGLDVPEWGFSGSPVPYGDTILLNAGDAGIALRKKDGAEAWKSANGEAAYSTPYLFQKGGKDLAIVSNKKAYVCVDPKTGAERWRFKWLTRYGVNAADPVVSGDSILISTGYDKGACLLKWTGTGSPEVVWQNRDLATQLNPAILINGYVYGISGNESVDGTGLKAVELATGKVAWSDPSTAHGAAVAANGQLIVVSEQGDLQIGPASPKGWKPTVSAKITEGRVWTQPVLSGGLLYVRNQKGEIVCLDLRG